MADVTYNLAQAPKQDVRAMAEYIASLSAQSAADNNRAGATGRKSSCRCLAEIVAIYTAPAPNVTTTETTSAHPRQFRSR